MVFGIGLLLGLIAERRHTPLIPHRLLTIGTALLFLWYAAQFSDTIRHCRWSTC